MRKAWRTIGASVRAAFRCRPVVVAPVLLALATAGCVTSGQQSATTSSMRGATVAFESIDGPPPGVFQKLVQSLTDEANSRLVAVVTREGKAQYRIRGYMAAHVKGGRTTISWLWDVYDAEQRRALRIGGEEPTGRGAKDAWATADDAVLRRIAQGGMERLAAFLAKPAPGAPLLPEPAAEPEAPRQTLAAIDDFAPEAAGIFRLIRERIAPEAADTKPETAAADADSSPPAGDIPTPPRRPVTAGLQPGATVALVTAPQR